jgi:ABC-2 type transport system ATP-binding protein
MNLLKITSLEKTYPNGVKALDGISLEIGNGMFGLLGPNGAGKSSLMRTIATLQSADSGTILFNDVNIADDPLYMRSNLGYLPQEFGVYPKISAYQLLNHLAVLKGVLNNSERHDQVISLLHQVNLFQHRNKAVHTFSGGMRQRFGIAQALLGNPKIIIVDEPTAGLDPEERNRFNDLLSEIGQNVIVVLSTHLVEDVNDLCSGMAIISNGKVLAQGNPDEAIKTLKDSLWTLAVSREELPQFKEEYNVISTRLHGGRINAFIYSQDLPHPKAQPISPTLADFYFNTLSKDAKIHSPC